jgi:hypothetical protein
MTSCDAPNWVATIFPWVAVASALLALDVMQKTERDEVNRRDPAVVQWLRRVGFLAMASSLAFGMYFAATSQAYMFWVSLFCTYGAGSYSLLINDLALRLRREMPRSGGGARSWDDVDRYSPDFIAATMRDLREDMRRMGNDLRGDLRGMDRGQLLTHLILQEVLLELNIRPPPARVETATILHPTWRKKGDA